MVWKIDLAPAYVCQNPKDINIDFELLHVTGDFTEKITSSVQRTDPNHGTEGSNLVGSINSVSSAISKRISEAARSNPENSHVEGLLPSSRIKSEVTGSELPLVVCGLTSISIAELTAKKTNTLNHDGVLAYCSRKRKRRKTLRYAAQATFLMFTLILFLARLCL